MFHDSNCLIGSLVRVNAVSNSGKRMDYDGTIGLVVDVSDIETPSHMARVIHFDDRIYLWFQCDLQVMNEFDLRTVEGVNK